MATTIKNHKDLDVWKKSIGLVKEIYIISRKFPMDEKYGIVQQIRRSAISIPSNIAEGAGRSSKKEFVNFLSIAQGSLSGLETQIIIAKDLDYISEIGSFESQIKSIRLMIKGLTRKLLES
jgi:four helix bundle protein